MNYDAYTEHVELKQEDTELITTDNAAAEADNSMQDLSQRVKQEKDNLKAGGRSGITGEFGKPVLAELDKDSNTKESNKHAYGQCWVFNEREDQSDKATDANDPAPAKGDEKIGGYWDNSHSREYIDFIEVGEEKYEKLLEELQKYPNGESEEQSEEESDSHKISLPGVEWEQIKNAEVTGIVGGVLQGNSTQAATRDLGKLLGDKPVRHDEQAESKIHAFTITPAMRKLYQKSAADTPEADDSVDEDVVNDAPPQADQPDHEAAKEAEEVAGPPEADREQEEEEPVEVAGPPPSALPEYGRTDIEPKESPAPPDAVVEGQDEEEPQTEGNHTDGRNILRFDGSVDFHPRSAENDAEDEEEANSMPVLPAGLAARLAGIKKNEGE